MVAKTLHELTLLSYVDLAGDMISLLGTEHGVFFNLMLCKSLSPTKGAAIYLSHPPAHNQDVFVGYISSSSPVFCLKYPFPTFGAVQVIRVGVRIMPIDDILAEKKKKKEEKVNFISFLLTSGR